VKIDAAINSIRSLDDLAEMNTPVHVLDPRAKVLVILLFVLTTVSFPKYEIAGLMPLFFYLVLIAALGQIPWKTMARYLVLAAPFAIFVGMFNPLLDQDIIIRWEKVGISGGWISFLSIILKFMLTASAALILVATTGYVSICGALGHMGMPRILVVQFLFLFRFIFILTDEASRMMRAHTLRAGSDRGALIHVWGSLAGHLLLRAHDRGQRLYAAMLARGFDGKLRSVRNWNWNAKDTLVVLLSSAFFALVKFGNIVEALGDAITRSAA